MGKQEPRKITKAEDVLAMSADEFHAWSQRRLAERIAFHERRKLEEERAGAKRRPPG